MMKKTFFILSLFIACAIVFNFACKKNYVESSPGSSCDTSHVSFQADVEPILNAYCYPCHSNQNKSFSNGIVLEGYDNFSGWAKTTYLLGTINWRPGFIPMPYGKPKLSDCSINTITAWINQGFVK
jgi:hypothetical protein